MRNQTGVASHHIGILMLCILPGAAIAQTGAVLDFDGSNDRVTIPFDASFPTEIFTIAAWVRLLPPGHNSAIIARGEDDNSWDLAWAFYVTPAGDLNLMVEDVAMSNFCYPYACFSNIISPTCTIQSDMFIADDQWHHVAATRSSSGAFAMYIDGVERAICNQTGVPSSDNFQDLTIGCTHGTIGPPPNGEEPPIWFFPGLIDDPAMWSTTLSAQEIQVVFAANPAAVPNALVGFWAFDENNGQLISDVSLAANHGFLGAAASTDSADPSWYAIGSSCSADFTGDGQLNFFDISAFLAEFAANEPAADFTGDGQFNFFDISAFLIAFSAGCP